MSSARSTDPTRTQDYRVPRDGRGDGRASALPPVPSPVQATRRGVGHDERRPPPAVLPKREGRVDEAFHLALATSDGLFRATLARGLVRAGCDLHIVGSETDVAGLEHAPDVAILDFDSVDAPTLFGAFHEHAPGTPVVALTAEVDKVKRALQLMKLCPYEVVPRRAPIADVLEAAKRLRG